MSKIRMFSLAAFAFYSMFANAAVHYVSLSGTNNSPYLNWADAATNIQWAVNAATAGDTVLVSNGTYYLTNQINITAAITTTSVNGREVTIVDGNYPNVTNRCFYITATATLDGFTVRNGFNASNGGGIYCSGGGKIKNCRITDNICSNSAALYVYGGGIYQSGGVVSNCEVVRNGCWPGLNKVCFGGGIYAESGALIINSIIVSNIVNRNGTEAQGGGIAAYGSTVIIDTCKIYRNNYHGAGNIGGGVVLQDGATLRNSAIYANYATIGSGVMIYYSYATIQNCTIVSNYGATAGWASGLVLATSYPNTTCVENVACYLNTPGSGGTSNFYALIATYTGYYSIVNSCIAPTRSFPTNVAGYYYANNIESNPQFVSKDTGDWHLRNDSPCINTGTNECWMTNSVDLDGRTRIRYGTVDIGCYEMIYEGTIYRFGF